MKTVLRGTNQYKPVEFSCRTSCPSILCQAGGAEAIEQIDVHDEEIGHQDSGRREQDGGIAHAVQLATARQKVEKSARNVAKYEARPNRGRAPVGGD